MKLKISSTLLFLMIIHNVFAVDLMPAHCKPIHLLHQKFKNPQKKNVIFMIHNFSDTHIWITHPQENKEMSAGWNSYLEAKNWSALALSRPSFKIRCIESKPGHEQEISCDRVLNACKWPVVHNHPTVGAFWAGENMSLAALSGYLTQRGFKDAKA